MLHKPPEKEALTEEYEQLRNDYKRLEDALKEDLKMCLEQAEIRVLSIESRVKDFDSFWGKAQRKRCDNPLEDIQDICGLRVICYYPSDLEPVSEVIKDDFKVIEFEDKAESLKTKEFGYRSRHFINAPTDYSLKTPTYRGLDGLKAEIQVRTIFAHAWAELSHELDYKKEEHAPKRFQRTLHQLGAMLENLDDQFDEVHQQKAVYVREVSEEAKTIDRFDVDREMNIDTLQAILKVLWPNAGDSLMDTRVLLDDLQTLKMTFPDIFDAYNRSLSALHGLEQDVRNVWATGFEGWSRAGILRAALDVADDSWWSQRNRLTAVHPEYARLVDRWRKKVNRHSRPTLRN